MEGCTIMNINNNLTNIENKKPKSIKKYTPYIIIGFILLFYLLGPTIVSTSFSVFFNGIPSVYITEIESVDGFIDEDSGIHYLEILDKDGDIHSVAMTKKELLSGIFSKEGALKIIALDFDSQSIKYRFNYANSILFGGNCLSSEEVDYKKIYSLIDLIDNRGTAKNPLTYIFAYIKLSEDRYKSLDLQKVEFGKNKNKYKYIYSPNAKYILYQN